VTQQVEKLFAAYSGKTVQYLFDYTTVLLGSTFTIINLVILIPIYTFFFLWRFGPVAETCSRFLPLRYKDRILNVTNQINLVTANFFRGRLLICFAVGLLTAIGFQIVGVPLAWPMGLAVGVLNLIPFLAPVVGLPAVMAICYISSHNWQLPMYALSAFIIPQIIDGWLLTPLVQGKSIGLHPITTIVVILIGSELAGMFGLLLAIPAAAAIKIIFKEFAWPEIAEAAGLDREAIESGSEIGDNNKKEEDHTKDNENE
jgi:predicted PurR-regulated permease PerM